MDRSTGQRYNDETNGQPMYCNKKYNDRKTVIDSRTIDNFPPAYRSCKKEFGERNTKVDLFGDYAETDLDQPTDYSLRYAEDDTDDDEIQSPEYFKDTVKTYCTEGTPYETPFNFSTATSMSDLLLEDAKEPVDSQKKLNKKDLELGRKEELSYARTLSIKRGEDSSLMPEKESEASKASDNGKSNCLSPEKLLDYYQAGTSDGFPRTEAIASLDTAITQRSNANGVTTKVPATETAGKMDNASERAERNSAAAAVNVSQASDETDSPIDGKSNSRVVDKEGKMVTFSRQDYYAEQTPLMFSRCSSLGSLSGFEQHSIHDDRSSIVSDFSRRTSGVVSPSELPDSPTQTIPPSPRNHKTQCGDFAGKVPEEAVRPSVRHLSYPKCNHAARASVFEDDIATFKEESTPIEFSTATSLSSLTIDDEVKIPNQTPKEISNDLEKKGEVDVSVEKTCNTEAEKDQEQVSDGDEDDEDMLAACISMGIQNNRYSQSFKTSATQKPIQPEPSSAAACCQRTPVLNRLETPVPVVSVPVASAETPSTAAKSGKTAMETVAAPDTVHIYCTEDTPADISPVGSQSNLSALSMPSVQEDVERIEEAKSTVECHRNDLSDESSNLSGDDEKILDECIQSGIPKVRQITPPPTACTPFVQKAEVLTQRLNICGTPSSSPVESGNKNAGHRKPMCRTSLEHENELSDDSPNHSDDEAILSECIRSAMPKVRLNISTLMSQTGTVEKTKTTATRKQSSSTYRQPEYPERGKLRENKPAPFEDNLSLSEEEEDIMLAQCIKSGMPKALNVSSNASLITAKKPEQYSKPRNTASNSYYSYKPDSTRDSTLQAQSMHNKPAENYPPLHGGPSSYAFHKAQDNRRHAVKNNGTNVYDRTNPMVPSARKFPQTEQETRHANENVQNVPNCRSPISNGTDNDEDETPCRNTIKSSNVVPSRHSSVSSLSEEGSLGSIEEWALLELCISSGMPRNKYRLKGMKSNETNARHEERDTISEDNYSICSYNSNVCKT